jgi:Flp pilus assembly protein TadD
MRSKLMRSRQKAEPAAVAAGGSMSEMNEPEPDEQVPAAEPLPEPPQGATPEAEIEHWRDVVLREPGNVEARRRLARVLESQGASALAVEQLETARAQQPEDVPLVVEYAHALTAMRRFDAAEKELRRVLKFQPDNADIHLGLGIISLRRGLYTQADLELKRATELDPGSGTALYYRADALNQLSRVDEALDLLARAAQLQPEQPRSYYLMGILYDKKGRPAEAGAMYRKAREVGDA